MLKHDKCHDCSHMLLALAGEYVRKYPITTPLPHTRTSRRQSIWNLASGSPSAATCSAVLHHHRYHNHDHDQHHEIQEHTMVLVIPRTCICSLKIAGNIMLETSSSEQVSDHPDIDRDWWKDS